MSDRRLGGGVPNRRKNRDDFALISSFSESGTSNPLDAEIVFLGRPNHECSLIR